MQADTDPIPTDLTIDAILRRSALRVPDRTAVRTAVGDLSFAALDRRVDGVAAAVARLVGSGAAVAVTPVVDIAFPVALHAVARSGNIAVTTKPMLRGDGLVRLFATTGVRLAFLTRTLLDQLEPVWDRLPHLDAVVLVQGDPPPGRQRVHRLADLVDTTPDASRPADPGGVAYVHFTHGTTGDPKGVQLTHRNLVANAVQTAAAHELDRLDVVLNHLPIYHCMHLNGPLWAGATQVLCTDPDPAVAIAMANTHRARCFYAQPGQLARLAADPRLPGFTLDTVEVIRTGGTDLNPATATTLSTHFGVPVIQGYGMVETAALTHSDKRARPKPGSVGPAVRGTECRIVDMDSGAPLPAGRQGVVQVRGPQVTIGYLGRDEPPVDEEGWLSTGDVGFLDADGYLSLVDRLGDLFKVGNELVSPTEIERILLAHPDVRECAVVGGSDEFLGSVPYALVVPATPDGGDRLADLAEYVNRQVAPHQRLRHIAATDTIPGAQFGKIHRRELRDKLT